jgi:hypothetical protein
MSQYGIGVNEILVFLCLSEGGESLLPRSSEAAHKIPRPTAWPTDLSEPTPIRIGSGSHDLDPPQNNSKGSDDAGSRQGTLQDMDLHCFHPVFVTTPRESYVIPRSGSNPGSGDIHRLVKRAATNRHSDQSRQSVIAAAGTEPFFTPACCSNQDDAFAAGHSFPSRGGRDRLVGRVAACSCNSARGPRCVSRSSNRGRPELRSHVPLIIVTPAERCRLADLFCVSEGGGLAVRRLDPFSRLDPWRQAHSPTGDSSK